MFHIVALVYILVNGGILGNEAMRVPHKMAFKDIDTCQTYLTSDRFAEERQALILMVKMHVRVPVKEDEDPPPFDVTLTASCEEDDTL